LHLPDIVRIGQTGLSTLSTSSISGRQALIKPLLEGNTSYIWRRKKNIRFVLRNAAPFVNHIVPELTFVHFSTPC
jgi:hypothetical protein